MAFPGGFKQRPGPEKGGPVQGRFIAREAGIVRAGPGVALTQWTPFSFPFPHPTTCPDPPACVSRTKMTNILGYAEKGGVGGRGVRRVINTRM